MKALEKLPEKIYFLQISGTNLIDICQDFKKIEHSLNNLESEIINKIKKDYEKHILGGFG